MWWALYSLSIIVDLVLNVFDCTETFFELTPHEAGYTLAGAFVETAYFGSIFNKGVLTTPKPEMDMTYLQGMWRQQLQTAVATFNFIVILTICLFLGLCGSALADKEVILKILKEWLEGMPKYITHCITIANMLFVTCYQYVLTYVVFRWGKHEGIKGPQGCSASFYCGRPSALPVHRLWPCSSASDHKWTATRWHLNTNQYNLFLYRFADIGQILLFIVIVDFTVSYCVQERWVWMALCCNWTSMGRTAQTKTNRFTQSLQLPASSFLNGTRICSTLRLERNWMFLWRPMIK